MFSSHELEFVFIARTEVLRVRRSIERIGHTNHFALLHLILTPSNQVTQLYAVTRRALVSGSLVSKEPKNDSLIFIRDRLWSAGPLGEKLVLCTEILVMC